MPLEMDLVQAVKNHAAEHYLEGWADVADTYTTREIRAIIYGARSRQDAIHKMSLHVERFPSNFNPNGLIG